MGSRDSEAVGGPVQVYCHSQLLRAWCTVDPPDERISKRKQGMIGATLPTVCPMKLALTQYFELLGHLDDSLKYLKHMMLMFEDCPVEQEGPTCLKPWRCVSKEI